MAKKKKAAHATTGAVIEKSIYAFRSEKGGTGKTTLALLTAFQASRAGKKTVFVDLDLLGSDALALVHVDAKTKKVPSIEALLEATNEVAEVLHACQVLDEKRAWLDVELPQLRSRGAEEHAVDIWPGTYPGDSDGPDPALWMNGYFSARHVYVLSELLALLLERYDVIVIDHGPYRAGLEEATVEILRKLGAHETTGLHPRLTGSESPEVATYLVDVLSPELPTLYRWIYRTRSEESRREESRREGSPDDKVERVCVLNKWVVGAEKWVSDSESVPEASGTQTEVWRAHNLLRQEATRAYDEIVAGEGRYERSVIRMPAHEALAKVIHLELPQATKKALGFGSLLKSFFEELKLPELP